LDYAQKMDIEPEPDAMAVLVQPLLAADSAGVLFTADPRNGNPWRFVLESTFGLAQELVGTGGTFAADRFVFEWDTGRIVEQQVAEKTTTWIPGSTGVENVALPDERRMVSSLSDETATRIALLALEIDRVFACRVDIEWVVSEGEIYVVQVRPITALPAFFPHYLPRHARDKTWRPATHWHFPYRQIEGKIMPPLYRDLSIVEKTNRYHQIGPVELPPRRHAGAEMDFNGHRYELEGDFWPQVRYDQQEAYLNEYEPRLRHDYLDAIQHRYPALTDRAIELQQEARSVAARIDAILWGRDAAFDMYSLTFGPSQILLHVCGNLLRDFLAQFLPDCKVEDLAQGHHPDLDPYFPQVEVAKAEKLAESVDADRRAFVEMDMRELYVYLAKRGMDSPFVQAFEEYCNDYGGVMPPSRFTDPDGGEWELYSHWLKLVRGALKGKDGNTQTVHEQHEQVTRRREACVAVARQMLTEANPDELPRFERLLDWALFWGPAINNRGWIGRPHIRLERLVETMCQGLRDDGLVETSEDIGYFTAEDLAHIAESQDIEEGRRIWRQRRHEYERNDRLTPLAYLGKAPDEPASQETPSDDRVISKSDAKSVSLIQGTGSVAGKSSGTARKIDSLEEADIVDTKHVLLFAQPLQLTAPDTPTLFSLMLRVRGMVCLQGPMMWTHHIGQIARECGVPIVLISPEDMARIPQGAELELDGLQGTVAIQ